MPRLKQALLLLLLLGCAALAQRNDTATTTTATEKPEDAVPEDEGTTTEEPVATTKPAMLELPLLVRGEPIAGGQRLSTDETTSAAPKARALNVSGAVNGLNATADLSDVSMDDEDKELEGGEYIASHNGTTAAANSTMVNPLPTSAGPKTCLEGNATYALGEKMSRGCEEQCVCGPDGKPSDCEPVCKSPLVRADRKITDPTCHARELPEKPCCAILVCADSAAEPDETCVFGNSTVPRGDKVEDGCSKTCICEVGGHLKCQPRCPPNDTASGVNQHDRCVVLQDPSDACCTITLCDVTLGDHEIRPETPADLSVNLTDVKVLNSTAIKLKLSPESLDEITIELSENNHVWRQVKPSKEGIISNLQPAHGYYVRVVEGSRAGPAIHVSLLAEVTKTSVTEKSEKGTCSHRGKLHKIGDEWFDDCIAVCQCNETAHVECVTIECPTDFGLDVLDKNCLDWETVSPDYGLKPPNCCPTEVRCRNNGSCVYEGKMYDNWSEIPSNVTGCEENCFCDLGSVKCSPSCPPVPEKPPSNLNCKPHEATLAHLPGDDCCMHWVCPSSGTDSPGKATTSFMYPGPVPLDPATAKRPSDKTEPTKPTSQEKPAFAWPTATHPPQPALPPGTDVLHYPMDPGHPTVPYIGPYNPDFKPTQPSVAEVFHLGGHTDKAPTKSKSKSDSKKPVDSFSKPSKEEFPGPLAPERFPEKTPPAGVAQSPNRLPGGAKGGQDQPQFIPLNEADADFTPSNGENIPPHSFDTLLENPAAGPAYDPNTVLPPAGSKKKLPESKPKPKRPEVGQAAPENIPDELYHLINLQHPGLIGLDRGPPAPHPGLYDIHQEINGAAAGPDKAQPNYFGPGKKGSAHGKPQIFAQKDENGQTTYHVHAAEVPNSPQQLEELLAHIAQHEPAAAAQPANDPYQPYPVPPHTVEHNPPYLGPHGFVPQAQPGFAQGSGPINQQAYEISVEELRPISGNAVRLMFTVPSVLVNLHGRVEVRYTSDKSNMDPSSWKSQTFAPPGDLIETKDLEFDLSGLKPSTTYKLMIVLKLRDLSITHTSKIYQVRTLDKLSPASLPSEVIIDAELIVREVNSTSAEFEWKKFSNHELQFIDGIYLTYKAEDDMDYSVTPLLHRSVNSYVLEHLRPSTTYEVHFSTKDIIGQTNVLINSRTVNFTTSSESDPYSFDVKVEIKTIKSTDVELTWSGVPQPQDKYVNIYRAVYQSDSGKEDTSTFKIGKKDAVTKTVIGDLKPGTRYRLWLEVYLTNGIVKKSNVQDFVTKPGVLLPPGASQQQGKLASIPLHEGDYYGPLVIVAIVASLAILSTLILLMMLMKRRTSSKADISPRKTTSAYDNPSYKTCEETVPNGRCKTSDHEMATMNGNSSRTRETA